MHRVGAFACRGTAIPGGRQRVTTTPCLQHQGARRSSRSWFSDKASNTTGTTTSSTPKSFPTRSTSGPMEFKNAAEKHEYLVAANAEMERYHNARELLRHGKLKPHKNNSHYYNKTESSSLNSSHMAQLGVVALFLLGFMATPFIGKRIARDEEFRRKWIPSWYDFTVPKPEKAWTRDELHEQMIAVQREIRERAIRGDFSPEKLDELQKHFEGQQTAHRASVPPSDIRKEWERIHPGLEEGEEVNED